LKRVLGIGSSILAFTALTLTGIGVATAAPAASFTCSGTAKAPGVLAGTHGSVRVVGFCVVNGGAAVVNGSLTVTPDSALVAAFGLNDVSHHGASNLTVTGSVSIGQGGAAILGCEPTAFPCVDDPNPKAPTLSSSDHIMRSLISDRALGVIVHNSRIDVNVTQSLGGGGQNCTPKGVFTLFKSPVFSDYEDNTVGANLSLVGISSCFLGALRNQVAGSFVALGNRMADPDANELISNTIMGHMLCASNKPAVQFGDSHGVPNVVSRTASGQCSFQTKQPNPAPNGPLTHISVKP
jgi:hypothetical protein